MKSTASHPSEIQDRLRKRYLDRLSEKMRRMRKDLVDRNWPVLKAEGVHLRGSGDAFGFPELTQLADRVVRTIPEGVISRARGIPEAKVAVDSLISAIDSILITHKN